MIIFCRQGAEVGMVRYAIKQLSWFLQSIFLKTTYNAQENNPTFNAF